MASTAKAVNYTAEQTAKLIEDFKAGFSVEELAKAFGKTTRSIVAKLSREGVYKAKERTTKNGEAIVSKEEFVSKIAFKLGVDAEKLGGLEKANKAALKLIFDGLA